MDRIRISNIPQLAGIPYRLLQFDHCISYQQGSPTENARKLESGEVDAALIPAFEFFSKGHYQSLGFGMACRSRSQSMVVYSHRPLHLARKVRVYECSSSSSALLKLLLKLRWESKAQFVREARLEFPDLLSESDAALMLHERPCSRICSFPYSYDLATLWREQTRLPFVFLIWAVRPGSLSGPQLSRLYELMYKASEISRFMAKKFAPEFQVAAEQAEVFVAEDRRYRLDDSMLAGLEEFLIQMQRQSYLEKASYVTVRRSLWGGVSIRPRPISYI